MVLHGHGDPRKVSSQATLLSCTGWGFFSVARISSSFESPGDIFWPVSLSCRWTKPDGMKSLGLDAAPLVNDRALPRPCSRRPRNGY
jgi:hypothetical protein